MKNTLQFAPFIALIFLCSCSVFDTRRTTASAPVATPGSLAMPVSKNWQIIEAAPKLSDEHGRLPFQTEQSLQHDVEQPVYTGEIHTIKAPL
jgi:hypothetical protein